MDKISEALGAMTPVEYPERALTTTEDVDSKSKDLKKRATENLKADYDDARTNLKVLIEDSMSLLPNLISLVRESETAMMYSSASSFIKMVAELNKDLLAVSSGIDKGVKETPSDSKPPADGAEQPTNIFIGTGEELFKALSKRRAAANAIEGEFTVTAETPDAKSGS